MKQIKKGLKVIRVVVEWPVIKLILEKVLRNSFITVCIP